ncbi:MAG: C40 family peptidase [Salinisphaera sp.]|nr:C40 family peptidase [Salinisphaera sp.]
MSWASSYIGTPYADRGRGPAYDCWGLVWAVYRDVFGIGIPSYGDDYPASIAGADIQTLIDRECLAWREQPLAQTGPLPAYAEGDVVILRMLGKRMHCGLCLADGRFLHVMVGCRAVIERLDSPLWRKRIAGVYRHEALA